MLPIYVVLPKDIEKKAHEVIENLLNFYMVDFLETEESIDHSALFPEEIYNIEKEKCDQVVKELYLWSRDKYVRDYLPILHEYALYHILQIAADIEEDCKKSTNKSLFFSGFPQPHYKEEDKEEWELGDIAYIDFYIEVCFIDHDFLWVPLMANAFRDSSKKEVIDHLGITLDFFADLMPLDIRSQIFNSPKYEDMSLFKLITNIIKEQFIHGVVKKSAYKLLWDENNPKAETEAQILFYTIISGVCEVLNIDISPETDTGRGPVDFKFMRNNEKVLVEMKLGSGKLEHGLTKQLIEYMLGNKTEYGILLVICYKKEDLLKKEALEEHIKSLKEIYNKNVKDIEIIMVDASKGKKSASKLNETPTKFN